MKPGEARKRITAQLRELDVLLQTLPDAVLEHLVEAHVLDRLTQAVRASSWLTQPLTISLDVPKLLQAFGRAAQQALADPSRKRRVSR
jgi:hypothetical protein